MTLSGASAGSTPAGAKAIIADDPVLREKNVGPSKSALLIGERKILEESV
jgi:hypothetical protein